nr:hypothetical protein [Tanacetum cinerariifolium]
MEDNDVGELNAEHDTYVRYVLTQEALDAFCNTFHILEEKSGWMPFSKRFDNVVVCNTKPLDSFKNGNNRFFWVDDFTCPASFPWHTAKHVMRDPAPVAAGFNARDYAILVAHPSPF